VEEYNRSKRTEKTQSIHHFHFVVMQQRRTRPFRDHAHSRSTTSSNNPQTVMTGAFAAVVVGSGKVWPVVRAVVAVTVVPVVTGTVVVV
jgi:hypothetical protein